MKKTALFVLVCALFTSALFAQVRNEYKTVLQGWEALMMEIYVPEAGKTYTYVGMTLTDSQIIFWLSNKDLYQATNLSPTLKSIWEKRKLTSVMRYNGSTGNTWVKYKGTWYWCEYP